MLWDEGATVLASRATSSGTGAAEDDGFGRVPAVGGGPDTLPDDDADSECGMVAGTRTGARGVGSNEELLETEISAT